MGNLCCTAWCSQSHLAVVWDRDRAMLLLLVHCCPKGLLLLVSMLSFSSSAVHCCCSALLLLLFLTCPCCCCFFFLQAAADNMLDMAKTQNPQLYTVVKDQIKAEQELQQLLGAGATHKRKLMGVAADEQDPRSSSSSGGVSDGSSSSRLLNQVPQQQQPPQQQQQPPQQQSQPPQQQQQQQNVNVGQDKAAGAGAAKEAPTVELDPTGKGLSQEALDSFKLFQDDVADLPATGTAGGGGTGLELPSNTAGTGATTGDGSSAGKEEQEEQIGNLATGIGNNAAARYDEFGDRLPDMDLAEQRLEAAEAAGGGELGGGGGGLDAAGVAEEYKNLMDEEYLFSDGKFANAADWEDEMFMQVRGWGGGGE